jgi:lysophospholipase L1-like esterase
MRVRNFPDRFRWLLAMLTFATATLNGLGQLQLSDYSVSNPIKIMAVGDSITDDCSVNGAWRKPLQPLLETNYFPFTFVGRQTSGAAVGFTKRQHEGYCGSVVAAPGIFAAHQYTATQNYLHRIVPDALATNSMPDVVLVWIGANDIGNGRNPFLVATNHMSTLLNILFSNAPNVNVILTKATRQENSSGAVNGANIPVYNAALQRMVNQRRSLGQKVFLADLYSVVTYPGNFSDGLHPTAAGLAQAANEWLARLQTITVRTDLVTSVFINGGASWKYNDTGQDLGTNWKQINFDDSSWSNGVARLGYGDSIAATTVSYGPQATNKYITAYFRRPFVVPDNVVITNLNLRTAQSDGAIVYLNGQEIYRTNLPAGPLTYTNLASSTLTYYPRYTFYPTNVPVILSPGTNWIAAEVHLGATNASVMGFDMELIGTGYPGPLIGSFQLSVPPTANEGDGTLTGQGNVTVNVAPTNDLVVHLNSGNTTAATVPASVVILAGQTNATFDIAIIDDGIANANKIAVITASANSYASAQASITVHNTDKPYLISLNVPASVTEGDGTLVGQGSLSVTPTPANDLTIGLSSSDTSEITVPSSVLIPAGQSNAVFNLGVVDDSVLDGNQVATITATALNYTNAQAAITIHDNDTTSLSVLLPASASENAGTLANAGSVTVGTPVAANFTVSLSCSDTSKLILPPTTVILNGQTSAVFNLAFVNNNIVEGPQNVSVTAHVPTWTDGSASINIPDDDAPDHFGWSVIPSPQLIGEPFSVTITALDASDNTMDYRLPVNLSAVVAGSAAGTNTILNSPTPQQSLTENVEYVLGYSFTPSTNLKATHVRHYFGDKVSIWTAGGRLLVSQNVVSVPGVWTDTPLPEPLVLSAGGNYLIMVHENGTQYFWSDTLPPTFADGTINQSFWDYGDGFPLQEDGVHWYFVDLKYARDFVAVPINPGVTTNFSGGTWSGNIAVLQAATNVLLEASANSGHSGTSTPFTVLGTPRLAISALSNSVVLSWPAAAADFHLEQGSTLSSWTNVPVTPAIVGNRYVVTNPIGTSPNYYRLRKP